MNLLSLSGVVILLIFEIIALKQSQKLIRLLIFSSIAEIGYIMLGIGSGTFSGQIGALLHLEYQLIMRGLVFVAAIAIAYRSGSDNIQKLKGMGKNAPFLAVFFAFGIFSVMGLSPFKGSISKFLIVYSNIEKGYYIYAVLAITGSVIEAWYFIRLIQQICFEESDEIVQQNNVLTVSIAVKIIIVLLGILTAVLTLYPEPLIQFTSGISGQLFENPAAKELPVFDTPWPIMVLIPYMGAFVVFIIGCFTPKLRNILAVLIGAATVYMIWIDSSIDSLSKMFALIVSFISLMAVIHSIGYMEGKRHNNRYYFFLFLTIGSLIGVATSSQFGNFYVFWELMTWTSYLLVVHEQTKKALKAGFLYFMMCTTGAYFMQFGILTLYSRYGTFSMSAISGRLHSLTPGMLIVIAVMFIIGTGVKTGLVPMHSWLPKAHPAAPAPVSAMLSGILTKIGFYGLIRVLYVVFGISLLTQLGSTGKLSYIGLAISLLGILTLFYGEIKALLQTDIKKLLAYSTMAQIGEIAVTLGIGTYLGLVGGFYHILNHAIMKGLLFLAAGTFIYRRKSQDIADLKGIGKVMPFTAGCLSIGILAIMGLPPFNGFISKALMLYANIEAGLWYFAALILLGSVIAAIYYIKLIKTIFFEKYEGPKIKDAPVTMLVPLGILTGLVIFNGLFPKEALNLVKPAADYVAGQGKMTVTAIPQISITWSLIIIIPMLGGLLTYFFGKRSQKAAGCAAVALMCTAFITIAAEAGKFDIYSLSYALLITFMGILNLLYSLGYMSHEHAQNRFYMFFMMMIGGLIGVAVSKDFFEFFIFWEIMSSWTLYFVIIHEETQDALKEGFKYFIFNYIGASIALLGMLILTVNAGTFDMKLVSQRLANLPSGIAGWALVLMTIGFLMKAAAMPFRIDYQMHPATAPTPVSGYISSVLLKSAPFWIIKLFFILGGAAVIGKMGMIGTQSVLMYVVSWIAGITIIGAAAMALIQKGIKRLLIYSTVSQIGYIMLGLSLGSTLGLSGGLLHLVNHMFFKDLLFLAAGVIMVQAHVKNLDEAGGLGKKMPFTMIFFMIGAMSLAGIPPFSGFTSKWLIYEAAMENGQVFLALLSLAGSVLTMAYFIKFLHSAFFGTVPKKFENVKEATWTMLLPMGILSLLCIVFGIMPGLPLSVISRILKLMNIASPEFTLFGVKTPLGAWSVGVILILMLFALILGIIFFLSGNRKVRYTSTYTCGVSDLEDDEIRAQSQNMYETPDNVIRKLHKTLIEPVFGNGEEVEK